MSRRLQQGLSLVELAVVLVISTLITAAIVPLIPLGTRAAAGDNTGRQLEMAQQAVLGHARAHGKLPAADIDGDGLQDAGQTLGWLPSRTLDLPGRLKLRYQVRTDLQEMHTASSLYVPQIPADFVATPDSANGLDLCLKLLSGQEEILSLPALPAAFALLHADGIGNEARQISGAVPTGGFETRKGDRLTALGSGELASRLACLDRLGRTQGAAMNAQTAYSAKQLASFNSEFRDFDLTIAKLVLTQANTGLAFASMGLAQGVFDEVMAAVLMYAGWPPDGGAIAKGITISVKVLEHATAAGSIGYAIYQLDLAVKDVDSAKEGIEKATSVKLMAASQNLRAENLYDSAGKAALSVYEGGLKQ